MSGEQAHRIDPPAADGPEGDSSRAGRRVRAGRAALAVALAELLGKFGSLAVGVLVARYLGVDELGMFSFALSFGLLLSIVVTWGFDSVLIQRTTGNDHLVRQYLGLLLVLRWSASLVLLLGTLASARFLALGPGIDEAAALVVLTASTLLDTVVTGYRAAAGAMQRQTAVAFIVTAQRIITAVFALVLVLLGFGLVGVAVSFLVGSIVAVLASHVQVRRIGVRPLWRDVDTGAARRLVSTSTTAGLMAVAGAFLFRVDQLILGAVAGAAPLGEYAAAYRLIETVLFLGWAAGRVLFPAMSERADTSRIRTGVTVGAAALLVPFVSYAILLLMRGDDVLMLLFGEPYASRSYQPLVLLSPTPILFGAQYLALQGIFALRRNGLGLVVTVAALVVNLAANAALIPTFGTRGAAIATTVSYLVYFVLCVAALRRCGVEGLYGPIARSLAVTAAPAALAAPLLLVPAPILLVAPAYCLLSAGLWFLLARRVDPDVAEIVVMLTRRRHRVGAGAR